MRCRLCGTAHNGAIMCPPKLALEELAARFMAALLISDAQGLWEDFAEDAFACADAFIKVRDEVQR